MAFNAAEKTHAQLKAALDGLTGTFWERADEFTVQITAAETAKTDAEARAAAATGDPTALAVAEAEANAAERQATVLRKLQADGLTRFTEERKKLDAAVKKAKDEMDEAKKKADAEVRNSKITHIVIPAITAEQVKAHGTVMGAAAVIVARMRACLGPAEKGIIVNDADFSGVISMVLADKEGEAWLKDMKWGEVRPAMTEAKK